MQTIGERLEEARKRKGVTIREAAEATKIRSDYLNSFENNQFDISVPEIYVRGFLRSYSQYLKVNADKLVTDYNATLIGEAKAAKREHREFFGRMELQQPLVSDASKSTERAEGEAAEPRPPFWESILGHIERENAIKIGIIAVIAVLLVLVLVWIFKAIVSDPPTVESERQSPSAVTPVAAETVKLIATGDVRVTVTSRDTGETLLANHPLAAGQEMEIAKRGALRVRYSVGTNLVVELRGQRFRMSGEGEGSSLIP